MLLRPIGKAMAEWFWLQEAHGLPTRYFYRLFQYPATFKVDYRPAWNTRIASRGNRKKSWNALIYAILAATEENIRDRDCLIGRLFRITLIHLPLWGYCLYWRRIWRGNSQPARSGGLWHSGNFWSQLSEVSRSTRPYWKGEGDLLFMIRRNSTNWWIGLQNGRKRFQLQATMPKITFWAMPEPRAKSWKRLQPIYNPSIEGAFLFLSLMFFKTIVLFRCFTINKDL